MLFISEYRVKPFQSKDDTRELMSVFAEVGNAPGTVAHYVAADGSKGWVITETDDVEALYKNALAYSQWLEIDATVALTVEDAVPHILEALAD